MCPATPQDLTGPRWIVSSRTEARRRVSFTPHIEKPQRRTIHGNPGGRRRQLVQATRYGWDSGWCPNASVFTWGMRVILVAQTHHSVVSHHIDPSPRRRHSCYIQRVLVSSHPRNRPVSQERTYQIVSNPELPPVRPDMFGPEDRSEGKM